MSEIKEDKFAFGRFLKKRLEEVHMTQAELSRRLGCYSKAAVNQWVNEVRPVPDDMKKKILGILNMDVNTYYQLTGDKSAMENDYVKQFMEMKSEDDAAEFIDAMLKDFEFDESNKVTMRFLLKNYALLALIFVMTLREQDEYKDDYDIETFFAELRCNLGEVSLIRKEYKEMGYARFEGEGTKLSNVGGLIYDQLHGYFESPFFDEMQFKIHLSEFISHMKELCYGTNVRHKYLL